MNRPTLRLQKNAEQNTNKIRIPKNIIEQWGNEFYMEIYENKITLIPIKKGN